MNSFILASVDWLDWGTGPCDSRPRSVAPFDQPTSSLSEQHSTCAPTQRMSGHCCLTEGLLCSAQHGRAAQSSMGQGAHLRLGGLNPVRPQLLLLRGRPQGQRAGGGGAPARGAGRVGRRAHARLQQLHAHHELAADQLRIALQRPLRPVLVLRHTSRQLPASRAVAECAG